MTWFKTSRGDYINIEKINFIGISDIDEYDKVLYFGEVIPLYIINADFIKLKKLLKLK